MQTDSKPVPHHAACARHRRPVLRPRREPATSSTVLVESTWRRESSRRSSRPTRGPRGRGPRDRARQSRSPRSRVPPAHGAPRGEGGRCRRCARRATGPADPRRDVPAHLSLHYEELSDPTSEGAKFVVWPRPPPPACGGRDNTPHLWSGLREENLQEISSDHCAFNWKGPEGVGRDRLREHPNHAGSRR